MGTVDDYLATVDPPSSSVIAHLYAVAVAVVPDAEQGTKYAMPCLTHGGKGLISVMRTRKHLAIYPFSGSVLPALSNELSAFDWADGTLRFQPDAAPSDDLVRRIVSLRRDQIDGA